LTQELLNERVRADGLQRRINALTQELKDEREAKAQNIVKIQALMADLELLQAQFEEAQRRASNLEQQLREAGENFETEIEEARLAREELARQKKASDQLAEDRARLLDEAQRKRRQTF